MKRLILALALISPLSFAHNLQLNNELPLVKIEDKGELVLNGENIDFQKWQSTQLKGKVYLIHHIAGRTAAKELNAPMIEAIKAAKLPAEQYQTINIINANDAMFGTSGFVSSSAEDSKKEFPWSAFILDANGMARNAWALEEESSAIALLDKQGKILFVKDGALNDAEIAQVMTLIKQNIQS